MAVEIIASHMKAESLGTQSDDGSTSLLPGHSVKRGSIAKKLVAGPAVNPHAGEDWQTRPVSAEQAVPTTPGMRNRSHEGGVIPSVTDRGPKE
jgi:hypothetical protein